MAKLSMNIKEKIKRELLAPFNKISDEAFERVDDHIGKLLKDSIPKEVLDMYEKHPQYFKEAYSNYFYFSEFGYTKDFFKTTYIIIHPKGLPINGWKNITPDMIDFTGKNKELFTKYMNSYKEALDVLYDMSNKLKCVFAAINTTKQLEMEFPEAFKIYKKIINAPVVDDKGNKCDKIEEVRAMINNKK